MTGEKIGSFVRELMAFLGAALVAWGYEDTTILGAWPEISGLVVLVASVWWGIRSNSGLEIGLTVFRKFVSAVGGVLVATGAMNAEQVAAVSGVLLSLAGIYWGVFGKGEGSMVAIAFIAFALPVVPGCTWPEGVTGGVSFVDPESGAKAGLSVGGDRASAWGGVEDESGRAVRWEVGIPVEATK